jgi:phenylacetate-CoA ligase
MIIRYSAEYSPFHRERLRPVIASIDQPVETWISRVPLLTKADIRANTETIISSEFQKDELDHHKTGGSTGVALTTYFDKYWLDARNADTLRANEWAGWYVGTRVAALWGNPPVPDSTMSRLRSLLLDRIYYLDTMRIDETSLGEFVEQWRKRKLQILYGHAHSIFLVARHLQENCIKDIRPRGIVSTSMMLLDAERMIIEKAFDCRVSNRYGCEEVGLIAAECELHGGLHLNSDHLLVEFLRPSGLPAMPGEEGTVVVTDLLNRGMPLIRYVVGDVGVPSGRPCPCGRGMPLMERIVGRTFDYLRREDGSLIAGVSLVERTLTAIPGVEQMQVIQDALHHITLKVVPDAAFNENSKIELQREFVGTFGSNTKVTIDVVSSIPQESSGKYRFAICKI